MNHCKFKKALGEGSNDFRHPDISATVSGIIRNSTTFEERTCNVSNFTANKGKIFRTLKRVNTTITN